MDKVTFIKKKRGKTLVELGNTRQRGQWPDVFGTEQCYIVFIVTHAHGRVRSQLLALLFNITYNVTF